MRVVAIVQARMSSARLPGKVMKLVQGTPVIGLLLQRLSLSSVLDDIVLACSHNQADLKLSDYVRSISFKVFAGSEIDVLDRFLCAARFADASTIVRITGDCPLVDSDLVDEIVNHFHNSGVDYCSNTISASFPDGLDVEVFSREALETAARQSKSSYDREHVTPFIKRDSQFSKTNFLSEINYSHMRWTLDETADLQVIKKVFEHFSPNQEFSWLEVVNLYVKRPDIFKTNAHIQRDEGSKMGSGQKLWKRAKAVIPGGNMLLSKRAEMHLPGGWPSYFSKAKGCRVWDLDDVELVDMSLMGVGTNILGYGNDEVDMAVQSVVSSGNMSTLNCPEEVYLAEKLVELHPWSEMVRFARTGGEANAIAIRIARAASARDMVALCGYHGWHDWYLAANLRGSESLGGHLLPGLEPTGVPSSLADTIRTFDYNDLDRLRQILAQDNIGTIVMEVRRNHEPNSDFLTEVRKLADQNGAVLIFDECTSGFRECLGGLHLNYGVSPDLAIFGKALGNGYAITAVIGKSEIMQEAQNSFISSTFWTERIGPTAGLKTIDVMQDVKSYDQITKMGRYVMSEWRKIADDHGVSIDVFGLPSMASFQIKSPNAISYKTLITQEMLRLGYLASTSIYLCTEHTQALVDDYLEALDEVFTLIVRCEDGADVNKLLAGPICHNGFRRLN